jgi:hypothetical protein
MSVCERCPEWLLLLCVAVLAGHAALVLVRGWVGDSWHARGPGLEFLVPPDAASAAELVDDGKQLSFELKDSFRLYGIGDRLTLLADQGRELAPAGRGFPHLRQDVAQWVN